MHESAAIIAVWDQEQTEMIRAVENFKGRKSVSRQLNGHDLSHSEDIDFMIIDAE